MAIYNAMLSIHEAGITFLREQCNLLVACLKPMMQEVSTLATSKWKTQEAEILLEKVTEFATSCKKILEKCVRKGVFKRAYANISQQKKWRQRFKELHKTLSELHFPVTLQVVVSNLFNI